MRAEMGSAAATRRKATELICPTLFVRVQHEVGPLAGPTGVKDKYARQIELERGVY